jgi:hypothetical protein
MTGAGSSDAGIGHQIVARLAHRRPRHRNFTQYLGHYAERGATDHAAIDALLAVDRPRNCLFNPIAGAFVFNHAQHADDVHVVETLFWWWFYYLDGVTGQSATL